MQEKQSYLLRYGLPGLFPKPPGKAFCRLAVDIAYWLRFFVQKFQTVLGFASFQIRFMEEYILHQSFPQLKPPRQFTLLSQRLWAEYAA